MVLVDNYRLAKAISQNWRPEAAYRPRIMRSTTGSLTAWGM